MLKPLLSLLAALTLVGCYDSTHHRDAGGDADDDIDEVILPRCDEAVACAGLGFDVGFEFAIAGEVVTVESDHLVLLGDDGVPVDYLTCGLDPRELLATGDVVAMSHSFIEDVSGCWVSMIHGESGPLLVAADCEAETGVGVGDGILPPIPETGWDMGLEPACEGFIDYVCFPRGEPVHLDLPERVFNLSVTTESGVSGSVAFGESSDIGAWRIRLLDARANFRMSERGCGAPAMARTAISAMRSTPPPASCPEPPELDRTMLGFPYISAATLELEAEVASFEPDGVILQSEHVPEMLYGWYGPDPSLALEIGQPVVARRYDWDVTGGGFLDVLEIDGEAVLAVTWREPFSLELPDLSVIGVTLELGEPCTFDQGTSMCSEEVLVAERYPVLLSYEGRNVGVAEVGRTVDADPYQATLLEATQYPGMFCPDIHVEAWGPFALTLLRAR